MRYVGTIMKAVAALLTLFFIAAPAWAANNPEGYFQANEHQFSQDVEGDGYAMVYQKVNTKTLQLQNYMHGSGTMDAATLINSSQKKTEKTYYFNESGWIEVPATEEGSISFMEQNEMTYAPQSFAYGTGYYEQNPVVYNSKLKEKTYGKSYQEGISMHHQIEYAQAFKKDVAVDLECKESTADARGYGLAQMRIEEDVVEGAVHVGELLTAADGSKGWKEPLIEIEEDYIGSFSIKKDMKICADKEKFKPQKDWLSCCFGGYGGMDEVSQVGIDEEIFNCKCYPNALSDYDPAWGGNYELGTQTEQYPRLNK